MSAANSNVDEQVNKQSRFMSPHYEIYKWMIYWVQMPAVSPAASCSCFPAYSVTEILV